MTGTTHLQENTLTVENTTTKDHDADVHDPATATEEAGTGNDSASDAENGKANKEAAKYRVRAREAEAQRDALAERVERFQRSELERIASAHLASPADLLTLSGNELSDYLTESGNIDPEKVNADAAVILAERPGLRRSQPPIDPTQGHGPTLILRRASRGQRRFHRVPRNPQYPRYLRNRQLLQPAQPPDLCSVLHAQHSLPPWLAQPRLSRKLVKIELPRSGAVVSIQLPPTTR